ncbi:Signal transducer regulating beta-lactamase production, contains metallopeptidase domain [Tenacibaculum sp. MAR_2009_124]|uniref:M56 family metallopeptidase n=1 Tax=Tenacibaculum sp. MAR_2009_124 TaxID=1250059 RepID=UPI000896F258|nr:M56 family metallopeptidase [Tenacibaculum sp. MAR_2009_124]SEC30555.1 Signal transducer regulating beta-lactamase production, contains metallopeptidase domain [Tenacibaculum sp. MAR_2009_124]
MILYILKTITCLSLLLVFYHFFLEKEKMHRFNRFYLLGSIITSFLIPLFIIETTVAIPIESEYIDNTFITATSEKQSINYLNYFLYIWFIVSGILLIRFFKNLWNLIKIIKNNQKIQYKKATLILVDDSISPYTFWNYIFINKKEFENKEIEKELFTHELTHVTQRHTFDIIILELLLISFWFNPMFYLLKKYIRLNHEFLADNNVIILHNNISEYQHLLLNKAAWNNNYYLASNFNYSLTKKRLVMMTTNSSKTKILLKKLAVVPLIAGFTFVFAERVEAQQKQRTLKEVKSKDDKVKDVHVYNDKVTYTYESGKTIVKKRSHLTEAEKQQLPPPPPTSKIKGKIPPPPKKLKEKSKIPPPPPHETDHHKKSNEIALTRVTAEGMKYHNRFGSRVTKDGRVMKPEELRKEKMILKEKARKSKRVLSEVKQHKRELSKRPSKAIAEEKQIKTNLIPPVTFVHLQNKILTPSKKLKETRLWLPKNQSGTTN